MSDPSLNISQLSTEDQLKLLDALWDNLSKRSDLLPLTRAQRDELDRRIDSLESDEVPGIPWEEVLKRIQGRSK